jgi:hypothetical protein
MLHLTRTPDEGKPRKWFCIQVDGGSALLCLLLLIVPTRWCHRDLHQVWMLSDEGDLLGGSQWMERGAGLYVTASRFAYPENAVKELLNVTGPRRWTVSMLEPDSPLGLHRADDGLAELIEAIQKDGI